MSNRLKKTYIEKNTNSETKLLIIAEHAGNLIPPEFDNLGLNDDDRRRHISYDIGVFGICRILSEITKDHIIMTRYSRLLVDLKRGMLLRNWDVKKEAANRHPYQKWLKENRINLEKQPWETKCNLEQLDSFYTDSNSK